MLDLVNLKKKLVIPRSKRAISGIDQSGISKDVRWNGGDILIDMSFYS